MITIEFEWYIPAFHTAPEIKFGSDAFGNGCGFSGSFYYDFLCEVGINLLLFTDGNFIRSGRIKEILNVLEKVNLDNHQCGDYSIDGYSICPCEHLDDLIIMFKTYCAISGALKLDIWS